MNSFSFIEVDLQQAESRFVAFDGPVPKLQKMYEDKIDIHRFVAAHPLMFNKPQDQISDDERQLGKKTGHAANYGMSPPTLSDQCLKEMDLVVPIDKAKRMLDGYHAAMDGGILRWQAKIRDEVSKTKKLTTPMGRVRFFYDRIGDDLFREAYAYRPQSTIPDIINRLIRKMYRSKGVTLLAQIHDSALMQVRDDCILETLESVKDQDSWNPILKLSGGNLRIPIDIKIGKCWDKKKMEKAFSG